MGTPTSMMCRSVPFAGSAYSISLTCAFAVPDTGFFSMMPLGTVGTKVWAIMVCCGSYTMTYATPVMSANWSKRAWTVEASRLTMRSTLEEARLFAMAVPLFVNSSVRLVRSDW